MRVDYHFNCRMKVDNSYRRSSCVELKEQLEIDVCVITIAFSRLKLALPSNSTPVSYELTLQRIFSSAHCDVICTGDVNSGDLWPKKCS